MPGSTSSFSTTTNVEVASETQHMTTRQAPPITPRALQSWQQATSGGDGDARSASIDSLESSSDGGNRISDMGTVDYISTRTVGKTPKLPPHNPLQFVKVHSPLYRKAEQQIQLTKEVHITKETLKEGEEEWQSNLDNWKSRRRKVSEKVIQRAEEMRQIEAEEQFRQKQLLQQQKKIKKFSEIVEKKSARSYNLDLYIGQGDDSGLGGTPEPDDMLDCHSSLLRSDTSEGMTSEAESVDSDIHKITEKEPPKVPEKPYSRLKKSTSVSYDTNEKNSNALFEHCHSTEPSDVEGHAADTEATSSEEDAPFSTQTGNTDSGSESLCDNSASDLSQDSATALEKSPDFASHEQRDTHIQISNGSNQPFKVCIKHGDSKGFGFTLKGGKDQGSPAYIENVIKGSPAEEIGLKDGDKIISLNGELTADYSHASLIFAMKQAIYTGILDIIINRSENCEYMNTEMNITESRKGKSFAEKLAIFTAGVSAPKMFTDDPKSKLGETKKESLVLRRRSAFENGKAESIHAGNRRSSCISHPVNTGCEKDLEKRHSIDFVLDHNIPGNGFSKKGPPPPVPVKPKIKSKPAYFELNKSEVQANEDTVSPPDDIICSAENHSLDCHNKYENLLENQFHEDFKLASENAPADRNKINSADCFVIAESLNQFEINDLSSHVNPICVNKDDPIPNYRDFDEAGDNTADIDFASFEANELDLIREICNEGENTTVDFPEELRRDSSGNLTGAKLFMDEAASVQDDVPNTTNYSDDIGVDKCSESDIIKGFDSISSACHSACDNDDNKSHGTECQEMESKNSPLCLSLEKIDEDDVISASTTTSSDTPDTETVIETLPSNLSPLPNDESNGEDSSNVLNCQSSEANKMSSTETNGEKEMMHVSDQQYNGSVSDNGMDYNDQQDDEYARELDESLDQITSLDIIDRIEQSLMDQLQKEDSYEDISTNLNSQHIDNSWIYYSEESELLEDLTPRNLEPPRDPPPPPPPPEVEKTENKITVINRTNSTKRIKKELWRRRSDFLGLDSPEVIDVDNIPPPPPGLEELLKQEREQTQWLEKRLSLAEPEIETSSYSAESTCLDSGNYSNNLFFVDQNIESPEEIVMDSEPERWKDNTDEEPFFEASYGVQYESAPETLNIAIEENVKSCESPQHKAKQNIQNLGAAPKAKIIDSTKWITEKVAPVNKKAVFRQTSCNQNYWLAQDGELRRNRQFSESHSDRRYSMPPIYSNTHPDVTVRTWGDREYEYQQHRPRSAIYERSGCGGSVYDQYESTEEKALQRTHSLDMNYETDTLESEVHKCSCCGKGLCEGSAMGIEALRLYFHIECFRCCLCHMQLGNGSCGTDVQVKNNQLYCPSCFTVD